MAQSTWTQVHLCGLPRSSDMSDTTIETLIANQYGLDAAEAGISSSWAGPGSTLVKRDEATGHCRGYAFLAFHSREGATSFVDSVNDRQGQHETLTDDDRLPWGDLKAELSRPKKNSAKKGAKQQTDYSDLRLRRQRKAPVRKHPVIVSSDGKRTNLGNKTR
mmetsp:Transcript_32690/g.78038  ORF Transcript_32690/g.78038 Transcript_32690/m.78038 type:complete len:162 (-) Transcript_32690:118-603(-)